jgi:hypothetical protein
MHAHLVQSRDCVSPILQGRDSRQAATERALHVGTASARTTVHVLTLLVKRFCASAELVPSAIRDARKTTAPSAFFMMRNFEGTA